MSKLTRNVQRMGERFIRSHLWLLNQPLKESEYLNLKLHYEKIIYFASKIRGWNESFTLHLARHLPNAFMFKVLSTKVKHFPPSLYIVNTTYAYTARFLHSKSVEFDFNKFPVSKATVEPRQWFYQTSCYNHERLFWKADVSSVNPSPFALLFTVVIQPL